MDRSPENAREIRPEIPAFSRSEDELMAGARGSAVLPGELLETGDLVFWPETCQTRQVVRENFNGSCLLIGKPRPG